jgi:hypothetical protein
MYASASHSEQMKAVCAKHGHMDPLDRHGKCWRCGEKLASTPAHMRESTLKDVYQSAMPKDYLAVMFNRENIAEATDAIGLRNDMTMVRLPVRGGFGDVIAFAEKSLKRAGDNISDGPIGPETGE